MEGAKRLALGIVGIPYTILVSFVLMVLGVGLWLVNNAWELVLGSPLLGENTRVGYYLYWSQNNFQAIMSGRGEFSLLPGGD
jgi:hypothetical protein